MKQFEEVDLINSKAIADSEPRAMENSLYEAVETKEAYVDVCLKRTSVILSSVIPWKSWSR